MWRRLAWTAAMVIIGTIIYGLVFGDWRRGAVNLLIIGIPLWFIKKP